VRSSGSYGCRRAAASACPSIHGRSRHVATNRARWRHWRPRSAARAARPRPSAALRSTLEPQLAALGTPGTVRLVDDTDTARLLFTPGIRLEGRATTPEPTTDGWFRSTVPFATWLAGGVRPFTIVLLARNANALDDVRRRLDVEFSVYDQLPIRAIDLVETLRAEHRRRGGSMEDLKLLLEEPGT
jgi:hypothetical protein